MPKWLEQSRDSKPGSLRTYRVKFVNDRLHFRSQYYTIACSQAEATLEGQKWGRVIEVRLLKKDIELDRHWEFNERIYNKFWTPKIDGVELIDQINRYSIFRRERRGKKNSIFRKVPREELYTRRQSSIHYNNRFN